MADKTKTLSALGAAKQQTATLGLTLIHYVNRSLVGFSRPVTRAFAIGRDAGEDVWIALTADERVSRRHASIERHGDRISLRDEGSRNGTFVNGERVRESVVLAPGDVIRIGESLLYFGELTSEPPVIDGPTVGQSAGFHRVWSAADRVAPTDLPVLITGASGSGKEAFARRIHTLSKRSGQLVVVNCGAVPETLAESLFFGHKKGAFTGAVESSRGYFVAASHGTLFLDEVGELPMTIQPKLLRVLDSGEISELGGTALQHTDARVVAATNVDLPSAIEKGKFRADLYARLSSYVLEVPPLRERRPDILLLASRFHETLTGAPPDWPAEAWEMLLLHDWPMNARELRSVVQRLVVDRVPRNAVCDALAPLAADRNEPQSTGKKGQIAEPATAGDLRALLSEHKGNIRKIAELTGSDRRKVYRWLEKFDIDPAEFRDDE